jgi:hypothetical protein
MTDTPFATHPDLGPAASLLMTNPLLIDGVMDRSASYCLSDTIESDKAYRPDQHRQFIDCIEDAAALADLPPAQLMTILKTAFPVLYVAAVIADRPFLVVTTRGFETVKYVATDTAGSLAASQDLAPIVPMLVSIRPTIFMDSELGIDNNAAWMLLTSAVIRGCVETAMAEDRDTIADNEAAALETELKSIASRSILSYDDLLRILGTAFRYLVVGGLGDNTDFSMDPHPMSRFVLPTLCGLRYDSYAVIDLCIHRRAPA